MTNEQTPNSGRRLVDLLRDTHTGLRSHFPGIDRRLSLLDALKESAVAATADKAAEGRELHQGLSDLLDQLEIFASLSRCPILAIAGLLNAGKSSLLATYLTPLNRPRVLRGLANQAGTHRFVLWLPQVWWDDAQLLNTLVSFLTDLFGHAPEKLADDPGQAALQYNGHINRQLLLKSDVGRSTAVDSQNVDPLSVPLLAYDSYLDELRVGLIDCPDIQTGFHAAAPGAKAGLAMATNRREQLSRIGRLCSAFIVVAKLNSLHDESMLQVFSTLQEAMPGVPRMLAINMVKSRYAPATVLHEARGLVERFGIDAVFAAYDYRSSLAHTRLPPAPSKMLVADEALPIFFELEPVQAVKAAINSSQSASAIRYLFDLGERLDAGSLAEASSRSLVTQLRIKSSQALDWLSSNERARAQRICDAWQAVADACYEFMAERDASGRAIGLRLQASPAIIAQMVDSLQRTAPMWMRASLSIDRTVRQLHQAISNSASRFKLLHSASQSVTQFARKFRRGEGAQVVTPQRLAQAIRDCDQHDAFGELPIEQLVTGCEQAMKRFADEDKTRLDEPELDSWSRQVWQEMSWKDKLWKGTQPLAVIMAPLLAAVLVPIDGGGTAVLVFASAKELLAAAGIAAVMAPIATGGETLSIIQRETPWRQLSDLFAVTCDSLGIPRPCSKAANQSDSSQAIEEMPSAKCGDTNRRLLASTLESKPTTQCPVFHRWEFPAEQLKIIRLQLQQQA